MDLRQYLDGIYIIPILLFSVIVHENAHGWIALKCGDPTAKDSGRITFNPIPHIDLIGTIIVPLISILSIGSVLIAWAKPVPVNPLNFSHYRRDDSLVSAAGPISNFIIAFFCTVFVTLILLIFLSFNIEENSFASQFLVFLYKMFHAGIFLNVTIAIFNLIPIPPLDGSHVFSHLLPDQAAEKYRQIGFTGIFILIGVFYFVPAIENFFFNMVDFFVKPYSAFINIFIHEHRTNF